MQDSVLVIVAQRSLDFNLRPAVMV